MLFDQKGRTYTGPADHAEPTFRWLNRSAAADASRLRETVEDWFTQYPDEEKADLRARYRSSDDRQHQGAAFELLTHQALLEHGYEVVVHPDTQADSSRQPDFLAIPSEGEPFYVEATVVTGKSDEERAAEKRQAKVYDLLDDLESPNFFLSLTSYGTPRRDPPTRRMRAELERELAALDPDEVAKRWEEGGQQRVVEWRYELEGWELRIFPIPKSADARGEGDRTVGMWGPGVARLVDPGEAISESLRDKAYAYGELEHPFVIAVNLLSSFSDWDHMDDVLFGSVVTQVPMLESGRPGEPRTRREGDGLWYRGNRAGATHVSAVLTTLRLRTWNARSAPVRVYENPWADRPLTSGLDRLPWGRVGDTGLQVEDGDTLGKVLGLPEGWPQRP